MGTYWYIYAIFMWTVIAWMGCTFFALKYSKQIYFAIVYIPLSLFAGLRHWSTSDDTGGYLMRFYEIESLSFDGLPEFKKELGYGLLNLGVSLFTNEAQYILIVCAFLTICGYGLFFYKYSPDFYLSTVLFVGLSSYFYTLVLVRQYLAMMILLWATRYLWIGQRKRFVFLVALAASVHISALIFMPFVFLYPLSVRKVVFCLIGFSLVAIMVANQGLGLFKSVVRGVNFFANYAGYIGGRYDHAKFSALGAIRNLVWGIVSIYGVSYVYKKFYKNQGHLKNECAQYLLWSSIFVFLFSGISFLSNLSVILWRIAKYFGDYLCLLLPVLLSYRKQNEQMALRTVICVGCMIMIFYFAEYQASLNFYEYRLFFD